MSDKDLDPGSRQKLARDIDNSLRGNAMRRALQQKVPRTLTPYEWQLWYAENGVPQEHLRAENWVTRQWRKAKRWLVADQGK